MFLEMRQIFITAALALLAAGAQLKAQPMTDGHQLTTLWKQYQEAYKADRPQKEADILSQIKQEAAAKRLPVDFYDAATEYVNSVQRRDWKQRDQLRQNLQKEIEDYNEPIVTFRWMKDWAGYSSDAIWQFVQEHPDGFEGLNRPFHRGVDGYLGGKLRPFIRSDKEYVLWALLGSRRYIIIQNDGLFQLLKEEVAGVYPNELALDFYAIGTRYWPDSMAEDEMKAYEELADRYPGKAAALYPRGEVFRIRKQLLDRKKADAASYKALYDEAKAFEAERKSFTGDEATIAEGCTGVESLCRTLTGEDVNVSIENDRIVVLLHNLKKANVVLREGKKSIQTWRLTNPVNSFYVPDTMKIAMPKLADGSYSVEVKSGDNDDIAYYTQYTLSIATRHDNRGVCAYVADYETGVPLRSATLYLYKGDKQVAKTTLKLDGFTPLPQSFKKVLDSKSAYYTIVAGSGNRKSRPVSLERELPKVYNHEYNRCNFYRDRGAYNPGDSMHFKAVFFKGNPATSFEVLKGKKVKIRLKDSEGNVLENKEFTTNSFGSVSGCFLLPKGLRNGYFSLEAEDYGSDSFRVDEFVLPTFDLSFDPIDKLYLTSETIPVRGRLTSYSGHNVSGARISARVRCYSNVVWETEVPVEEGNTFCVNVPAKSSGYYDVELTVTEASGETHEFSHGFFVGDNISVRASVLNAANADLYLTSENESYYWRRDPRYTVTVPEVKLDLSVLDNSSRPVPGKVSYTLLDGEKVIAEGEVPSMEPFTLTLPGNGFYTLKAGTKVKKADGTELKANTTLSLLCSIPGERSLSDKVSRVFIPGALTVAEGGAISARLGSSAGDAYALFTLFGENREVLYSQAIRVVDGTLENFNIPYLDSYPDAVRLQVFYFQHGKSFNFGREYRKEKDKYTLPLQYTRFHEKGYPGVEYSFSVKTAPDAEVLAAAWDKSVDAIARNYWPLVNTHDIGVDAPYIHTACGVVTNREDNVDILDDAIHVKGAMFGSRAKNRAVMDEAMPMLAMAVRESADVEESFDQAAMVEEDAGVLQEVTVREVFAQSLTFQPHLRPQPDGTLTFSFRTSDKLSTYYVRVLAHDAAMRNAVEEKEMVVSLPVKVAIAEPRFLYVGDCYEVALSASSIVDYEISGILALSTGSGEQQIPVTIPAGKTVSRSFTVKAERPGDIVLTAGFKAADFSDAVRVTIPVYPAAQVLTEAHSAVLLADMDREALLKELRSRFVNVPGADAVLKEITVLDMVKDAIPSHVNPSAEDVLSLSEAWYVRKMASRLQMQEPTELSDAELLEKILACKNADGGFGWFEGMNSSAVITAVLLERFAKLRDRGFAVPDMAASVKFLDKTQFGATLPYWCGWVSDEQFLHIRALWADVPFQLNPVTQADKKRVSQFKKWAKDYLTPSTKDGRGLQGQILAKGRRLLTLKHLLYTDNGLALAKSLGISFGTKSKLEKSMKADIASLLEYAVEHRDGGWYYPNAVMPWRGLMESEAYAHSLLCDLMTGVVADGRTESYSDIEKARAVSNGIRIWLMLQKETQKWDTEPAYIDAITSILDGPEHVLQTRVLALSASYGAPFQAIKASGNGFKIERKFFREVSEERVFDDKSGPNDVKVVLKEIKEGDKIQVGDKIVVKYEIWNAENRSFVKLTAGREASLDPVQQLSGHIGYRFIVPHRRGFVWGFYPQGYRNVKASATEYYFDSYPEESTTLTEEFFVTRAGRFTAPVTVIESLYAPHYRANSAALPPLESNLDM